MKAFDVLRMKGTQMHRTAALVSAMFLASCANAQTGYADASWRPAIDPNAVQVMVVGSYHMAGSTSDLINVESESVLSAQRQRELEDVATALAAFNPNVVITERVTAAPDYVDAKFADFDDAMLLENENERAQIAYRLARRSGVTRVYGVDEQPSDGEPDYFPFDKLMAHAAATGQIEELQAQLGQAQEMVSGFSAETANDHIALKLLKLNTGPMSAPDFYYALSKYDQGESQPAAELQAYWFMRNAKIWSKLMDVTKPGDRVIVVYGAGHKFWLEHMADQTEGFIRIDPAPFLEKAAAN